MFEDNSYEPLAEIYLTLSGQPSYNDIYCLCSRVFVEGANGNEEEAQDDPVVEGTTLKETSKSEHFGESTVRFCNSSSESQTVHTPKKNHEEAASCYCSASHYSTDEHDSLRDNSGLQHSDSGADLSESSKDLDWDRYWTLHGERLIWESWISKYGSFIDPSYLQQNNNLDSTQVPAEGDETSFCVQSEKISDPNRRTSFSGLLPNVRTAKLNVENQSSIEGGKTDENAPQILVDSVKSDIDDFLLRRLSDISETARSLSGKSEDSNLDDIDRFRLSVASRCSGSSAPLSATTDSMTNVTRITLSSSDSSYGLDDSSGKSSSVLLSSDSANSVDQQWQDLWAEHFNQQYYYHYNKFTERYKKKDCEEAKTDSGFILEDSHVSQHTHHQESIDDVVSIETQDSVSEGEHSKPPSVSSKSSCKSDQSKKKIREKRLLPVPVGYILQQLKAMSVEPSEGIQEEDESTSLSRPSTMESVRNIVENTKVESDRKECVCSETVEILSTKCEQEKSVVVREIRDSGSEGDVVCCGGKNNEDADMPANSDEESTNVRHGIKRSHENEINGACAEKVKSAYQLMGFMFDLENTKKIRKASVWYKKRFTQIRFQNRILRLHKPLPNKHIYFDDEGEVVNEALPQIQNLPAENLDKSDSFTDALDTSLSRLEEGNQEQRKLEMEDFSEKDDSSDDGQDVFFSAEEDNLDVCQERRESKLKNVPKRKKKKQLKKKSVNYPDVMIANPKIKKFWRRRYQLFSKYDEGIKLDEESWYSVTPEPIATIIADRCRCDLVIDAFCGAGGNAIQLAITCERVIAIDIDPHKIELARHNARVYGVEDRIEFITGDFLQLAPTLVGDVVFMSPPWGGLDYARRGVYPLASLLPVGGQELYQLATGITDNVAFYLPKNVNTQEVVECAGPGGCVELVQNFHDRELVAITAYFGELVNTDE